jgi:hypothetical protein
VRVREIIAFAVVSAVIAACAATPLQVSDGGTGSAADTGGSAGAAGSGGSAGRTRGTSGAGGAAGSDSSSSGSCTVVVASDYDQSCVTDSDCVSVGQQPECPVVDCLGCIPGAINTSVMAEYMTALSHALMQLPPGGPLCNCPCISGVAICRGGKCEAAGCVPPLADRLPSCANADGLCVYKANTTCGGPGIADGGTEVPDGCAYSDEMCCVN